MTTAAQRAGVAGNGRLRPVVAEPQPVPTVCEACLTDTELGPCPVGCPERDRRR